MNIKIRLTNNPSGGPYSCSFGRSSFAITGPGEHCDEILKVMLMCPNSHEHKAFITFIVDDDGLMDDQAQALFNTLKGAIISWTDQKRNYEDIYNEVSDTYPDLFIK